MKIYNLQGWETVILSPIKPYVWTPIMCGDRPGMMSGYTVVRAGLVRIVKV